jgi:Uma2 family endonuclease
LPFIPPLVPGEPVPRPSDLQQALDRVLYPESDGKPIAENTLQFDWIEAIKGGLEARFADEPDVFVAADLLWYPVEGAPHISVAPDILVAFGRPKGFRGSYLQWREEGVAPQVVWEVLSPSNTPAEMDAKRSFYEDFGVLEYYEYDPFTDARHGWWRDSTRTPFQRVPNIVGWVSPLLGIRLDEDADGKFLIRHPDGRPFVSYVTLSRQRDEAEAARDAAEATAREAEAARDAEARRAEQLAARLRALGIDPDAEGAS